MNPYIDLSGLDTDTVFRLKRGRIDEISADAEEFIRAKELEKVVVNARDALAIYIGFCRTESERMAVSFTMGGMIERNYRNG